MNQNKASTRLAYAEDIPPLSELMTALGYSTTEAMRGRFSVLDRYSNYRLFVAELNSEIVRRAGSLKSYYFERPGCYIRLSALIVQEGCRRRGVGKALVMAVEDWGKSVEAKAVILNCGNREEREAAHLFYKQ
ncbi:MAG: GCN5-related N-acetyltransferase [Flaviaesturariibacter sp.]|nr:GCN5-related N-acetyltransferase [Flaviaesturariibacter sp.]